MLTKKSWAFFFCNVQNDKKSLLGKGRIFAIIQDRKYLASDKGFAMQPKSEWHEKAIRWLVKEMHK